MTLEELDAALEKTGLDLTNPPVLEARNMVLEMHGQSIIKSRGDLCSRCWYKENGKCYAGCPMYGLPDDPVEASKRVLQGRNDIQLFPFLMMYMIPVYEKLTGDKGIVERMRKEYKKMYKKKMEREGSSTSEYGTLPNTGNGV